ncbi:MAG: transcriptional regulator BetI [Alphaproteobacteria bacterium]|nr:transcriptional regulator BetI [Alphaproteobacteria bacterium]
MPRVNVKDKRKQQLIDANIASIAKRGLSETTIAHVSQGAGMSRGIVNFYFTTKESMMQETCQYLADEYVSTWERALEKHSGNTSEATLRAIVAAHFTSSVCNQKKLAVWVAFWGHASSHKPYQKIIAACDAAFDSKIREIWSQMENVQLEADVFAYEIHALIRGSWLNFLLSSQASERDALAAKCDAFVSRSISNVSAAANNLVASSDAEQAPVANNVTDLATAKSEKTAAKKKAKHIKEEKTAYCDLFALGK